jgi:hypothetical protein
VSHRMWKAGATLSVLGVLLSVLAGGESWFALVEYGSDKAHPTNAGSVLVKLTRVGG